MEPVYLIAVFFASFLLLIPKRARAAEVTLSAGAARGDITPDPAMVNWVDRKPYDGVLDPLQVRVLWLTDGGTEVAIVAWDLIDAGEESVTQVRKALHEATGIPQKHVLVGASHTHSGPRAPFSRAGATPRRAERMREVLDDPVWQAWCEKLAPACAGLAEQAKKALKPVRPAIGRADAGEWLFNRRPVDAEGNVVTTFHPKDPKALPDGLRFSPLDPTLSVLLLEGTDGKPVATLFTVPCHSVSIYPHHRGVSADWPGPACGHISKALGGETLFLQGCAGDIVPGRRGEQARDEMARFFADRAISAAGVCHALPAEAIKVTTGVIGLPLLPRARKEAGTDFRPVEIQVIGIGPVALVTLPGEPLNGLAREIQARSPFPHTVVVGYANGSGAGYVGLPGEKAKGGYEAGAGRGTEEAGLYMIETAVRLLQEIQQPEAEA